MSHEIETTGYLDIPDDMNWNDTIDMFLEFVESHGWTYCGSFAEIRDNHYIKPDGSLGKSIE